MPPDGARMLVEGFASYAPEILIIPGRGGVRQMLLTVSLCLAVVHVSVMVCAVPAISDAPNLVINPGFENGVGEEGMPLGWRLWVGKGGEAECRVDNVVRHGGKASAHVRAESDVRALLLSKDIPVSNGESFEVSAWFRGEGFGSRIDGGCAALTAAFLDAKGRLARFVRMGKPIENGRWRRIVGTVEVPEGISDMLLEVGLAMAHGSVWIDDVRITPKSSLAIRPASPHADLPPGPREIPIEIINRGGEKRPVSLQIRCSGRRTSVNVSLDGSSMQVVPVRIDAVKPGSLPVLLRLEDAESHHELATSLYTMRALGPLDVEPPIPTHFCVEDGAPKVEVRVWNNLPPDRVEKIVVVVESSSGELVESREIGDVGPAHVDVALSAEHATLGEYRIRVELHTRSGDVYTRTQPWHVIRRSQARVTLDDRGFPVADGKRVFVLGTFNSGRYDLMKKTGFTVTHAWNRVNLAPEGQRITHQSVMDFLNETHAAGLRAVLLIRHFAERGAWEECRRRVRMFRNHPALLAWVEEEEVARGEIRVEDLEHYAGILRQEDPNHPFVLADSYTEITAVDRRRFFRDDLMDIGMWWYYPIPLGAGEMTALLEGQDPSDRGVLPVPSFLASTRKPVWVGLQAYRRPGSDGRMPTPAEHRCMAYLALVHGARGLMYYMGDSAAKMEGEQDTDKPWGCLHDLIPELASMISVFAQADGGTVTVSPSGACVDCVLKRDGDELTLIALNRGEQAMDISLGSSALRSGEVQVLHESRSVLASDGRLSDRFEPYAVHIYRW